MPFLKNICRAAAGALLLGFAASPAAYAEIRPIACASQGQPLNEKRFVSVGGIEQWITIRGASCRNPVVLMLHGGPGNPLSPYAEGIYAAWEKDFTLVQWDQRGAGKTYGRNPEPAELSLAVMTRDGVELAGYLAAYLGQKKLILMGGSWGSVLGVHMAKARPDLFHAYVGSGQLVSYPANQQASYRRLGELASAAGDKATLDALAALGPPPWKNPRAFGILRRATRVYEAQATTPAPPGWWKPAAEYATPEALENYEKGEEFSYIQFVGMAGDGMLSGIDLAALGTRFDIPVYLVQGAEDLVTMPEVAKAYFDTIAAPAKAYRLVPLAGHDPNAAMLAVQYEILRGIAQGLR